MAKVWKVQCWRNGTGCVGNSGGEFERLADAVDFADGWIQAGWSGELTHPDGRTITLEKGKTPKFPRKGPDRA